MHGISFDYAPGDPSYGYINKFGHPHSKKWNIPTSENDVTEGNEVFFPYFSSLVFFLWSPFPIVFPFCGLRGHLKRSLGWGIPSKVKESTIPDRKRIYQPRKVFLGDILFRCRKSINIFSIFLNLDDQHEKLLPLQSIKPLLRIFHN